MTTYKTYQEAKIANPERDIATDGNNFASTCQIGLSDAFFWHVCKPSDYCMTRKESAEKGVNLSFGDWVVGTEGVAIQVNDGLIDAWNEDEPCQADDRIFILRAAALENPQPQTGETWLVEVTGCKLNARLTAYDLWATTDALSTLIADKVTPIKRIKESSDAPTKYENVEDVNPGDRIFWDNEGDKASCLVVGWHPEQPLVVIEQNEEFGCVMMADLYRKVERPIEWWEGAADYINTIGGEDNAEVEMLGKGLNKEHAQTAATLMLDVSHALEIIENEHGHEVVGKVAKLLEQEGE